MTRAIPALLAAELASAAPDVGECLILEARDGKRIGFTTRDKPQVIDLGLGAGNETCSKGMVLSALTLAAGLDASHCEVTGPLGPDITEAEVLGGKWTDAKAWLVQVSPGQSGFAPLLAGKVREAHAADLKFTFEIRNQADALNQQVGKVLSPFCDARLGDSRCGYALVPVAATVSAVTDAMRFSISYSGTYADDHFNLGHVLFLTGALAGVESMNLFDFTSSGAGAGSVVLWEPLPRAPEVGDTLEIAVGCPKVRPACIEFHGDARPFRGHPDQPGTEQLLRYPNQGA